MRAGELTRPERAGADTSLLAVLRARASVRNLPVNLPRGRKSVVRISYIRTTVLYLDSDPGLHGDNSRARLETAEGIVSNGCDVGTESLKTLLSDTSDPEHKICAPYQSYFGINLGTVCTVVMDLNVRRLELRRGPDPDAEFESFKL